MRLFRGYSVGISKGGMFMNWDQIGNWFVMFLSGCGVALEIFAVTLVCAIPLSCILASLMIVLACFGVSIQIHPQNSKIK